MSGREGDVYVPESDGREVLTSCGFYGRRHGGGVMDETRTVTNCKDGSDG